MIKERIDNYLSDRKATLLCVGPMSVNCVDVTTELANEYNIPLMLIASRRQIDSKEFGGGYVNNWTTEEFANYVRDRDTNNNVLLARDHGGPWQNNKEQTDRLNLADAMKSCKLSYKADIDAGFQVFHIDPSVDIFKSPSVDEILERVYELYEYCWNYANSLGKEIIFEIGTEEQSGSTNTQEELNYALKSIFDFCGKNKMPEPTFVVIQTGTRVMETRNVGSFDSPIRVVDEIPAEIQVPKMIEICHEYGIYLKQHNTDYLSDEALKWHPRLGIHSANVAPEFGVAETCALLEILERNNFQSLADDFIELAYNSNKWVKWMLPNTNATDRDRAVIAGHYVFGIEEFSEIKLKAISGLKSKGIDLDHELKNSVRKSIMRYLNYFRMIR